MSSARTLENKHEVGGNRTPDPYSVGYIALPAACDLRSSVGSAI